MPLLTDEQQAAGIIPGGEGAQWPRGPVAVSPANPDFLLLPIDVGGVYRSLDGGRHWQIAMAGWNARGANGFGIDPKNARHAIGIAANSMDWNPGWGRSPHGLYLTTNQAASWTQVLPLTGAFGGQVAFDPNSYDTAKVLCSRAYFFSGDQQFFRSDDGGLNWLRLTNAPEPGVHAGGNYGQGLETNPRMALDGKTGVLYLGGEKGLFRSTNHGQSWTRIKTGGVYSLAITAGGEIFVSDPGKIWSSADAGKNWTRVAGAGLELGEQQRIQDLVISPADPRRMFCWTSGNNFIWKRWYSHDGGAAWREAKVERASAPLPMNQREGYATWSPNDPQVAWSLGGDWVTKSSDGGATFHWSNNGYNGVMVGGLFNFTTAHPETVFLGFQDYNGAFTTNGGKTWNYRDVSGKGWGGHEYGAFALNPKVMWCGDAESWGTPRRLRLSRDGGNSWVFVNGADGKPLESTGLDVSCGDPADAEVGFAARFRTGDGGATWQAMNSCDAVFTAAPSDHALYGVKGNSVVQSTDHGLTWKKVTDLQGGLSDLAVDEKSHWLYAASEDRLKVWRDGTWSVIATPADQYGNQRVCTVATDPQNPAIIYVGGPRNIYASDATICRSTDAGRTWTNLTVTQNADDAFAERPHEVSAVRVHPVTHDAWVAGQCFGLWRIPASSACAPPKQLRQEQNLYSHPRR